MTELPPDIIVDDLKYPSDYKDLANNVGDYGQLTFHKINGRKRGEEWVIATLLISRAGPRQRGAADRTYAVTLDGQIMRVGLGPHVKSTVTIYLRKSRMAVLQKYVDLHAKGGADANQIRDRISSRRAQGQLERAAGKYSWKWDT